MALGVISLERHRPMARCAADRAKPVAAAPQVLHAVDRMHPHPIPERPYRNSVGVGENDDDAVGHLAWSHHTCGRRIAPIETCGETARGLVASFGHSYAFYGLTCRRRHKHVV